MAVALETDDYKYNISKRTIILRNLIINSNITVIMFQAFYIPIRKYYYCILRQNLVFLKSQFCNRLVISIVLIVIWNVVFKLNIYFDRYLLHVTLSLTNILLLLLYNDYNLVTT